ncbi:hypothetical protein JTB14_027960 [Gonioctena quinquepunctata]|nr:hypothetical protein JTB14_027960 [Gonioctena quinquepunctata]
MPNLTEDTAGEISVIDTPQLEEVEYISVEPENIEVGTFLLVRILSGERKSTSRYVCIDQEELDDSEYAVPGLKSTESEKHIFKEVENDKFTVYFADIIAVLGKPKIESFGSRMKIYILEKSVDVFER